MNPPKISESFSPTKASPQSLLTLDCGEELAELLLERLRDVAQDVVMQRDGTMVSFRWN